MLALAMALAACGQDDDSTLGRAEDAMAELDTGDLVVELSATTAEVAEPVGFRLDGRFQYGDDGELPVMDFTYTDLLAGEEVEAGIVSDGERAWVIADGTTTELSAEEAEPLRLGGGEGFADIGIASWVDDPSETARGDETVVTGTVDAADLLSDLSRLASQVGGGGDLEPVEGEDADRLAALVRSSEIEVIVGEDDLPRSVDATIDFGGDVPEELVDALGPYAAATLRLIVELAPLDGDLTVTPPE